MKRRFEWDPDKNEANLIKHHADFADCVKLFENPIFRLEDKRKDYGETRFIATLEVDDQLMVVVYTERLPNVVRIISYRKANKREQAKYKAKVQN